MDETQLEDLVVEKVALVGVPANRRTFAIRKDAQTETEVTMPENEVIEQAVSDNPEPVEKDGEIALLKGQVEALSKALRMKELEPICKELDLDAEKVFALEQVKKDAADYFLAKLSEANKRITELMKEVGDRGAEAEPDELVTMANKIAKERGISVPDALIAVGAERPEIVQKYEARFDAKQ